MAQGISQDGWRTIGAPEGNRGKWRVLAKCGCGKEAFVPCKKDGTLTRSKRCRWCAAQALITHGQSIKGRVSPLYRRWQSMKDRCFNVRCSEYENYGGRGITVCARWHNSYEAFEADVGPIPPGRVELDRINNDGNYEPGNVRWVPRVVNANNKRTNRLLTFNGETHTMTEWARKLGGTMHALLQRIDKGGMSVEQALTLPFGDAAATRRANGKWRGGTTMFIEFNGERLTPHQWAKRTGLHAASIRRRILNGWSPERAITTPRSNCGPRKAA